MLIYYDGNYSLEKIEKRTKRGRPEKNPKTVYEISNSEAFGVVQVDVTADDQAFHFYNDFQKFRDIPDEILEMIKCKI